MQLDSTPAIVATATATAPASSRVAATQGTPLASAETFSLLWAAMDATQRKRTTALFSGFAGVPLPAEVRADMAEFVGQLAQDTETIRTAAYLQWALRTGGEAIRFYEDAPERPNLGTQLALIARPCTVVLTHTDGTVTMRQAGDWKQADQIARELLSNEAKRELGRRKRWEIEAPYQGIANRGIVETFVVSRYDAKTKTWNEWEDAYVTVYHAR